MSSIYDLYILLDLLLLRLIRVGLDEFIAMDFMEFFTEDLEHREMPLTTYHKPWITSRTRERIDQLSNDNVPIQRPPLRGPAPCDHDMEPPIMPSEHWLANESPCPVPPTKLSHDMIVVSRLPKLSSLLTLWLDPFVHRKPEPDFMVESDNNSPGKERASQAATDVEDPIIAGLSSARTRLAEAFCSVEESDTNLAASFLPSFDWRISQLCIARVFVQELILTLLFS